MAKIKADDLNKISIWKLSSSELFKSSGIWADISNDDGIFALISYRYREEYKKYILVRFPNSSIMQTVYLTDTQCNFGSKRYWFLCQNCNKRVGVLYLCALGYFSCRVCLNLTYKSRNRNYRKKDYWLLHRFGNYFKANELSDQLKRFSYAGEPTKKVQRINYLYEHSIFL